MPRLILSALGTALLCASVFSQPPIWTSVYPCGTQDVNGAMMYGIQMMYLVPSQEPTNNNDRWTR
jgi:hypothetical protein